jgi:LysM repeat protein
VEVIQNNDPEVESINEPVTSVVKPGVTQANSTAPKSTTVYPKRAQPAVAENKSNDTSIFKSEPVTGTTKPEIASVFKDSVKANAVKNNKTDASVAVTITEHVVAKGETLYSISRLYGIPVDQLRTWNNLGEIPLSIGQSLQLAPPAGSSGVKTNSDPKPVVVTAATMPANTGSALAASSGTTQHVVSSGESMYQISRKYNVTVNELMEWNNKSDFNLSPGEKLTIKPNFNSQN